MKTSGGGKDFQIVGEQVEAAPYGIAVAKDNTQLRDALEGGAGRGDRQRRVQEGPSTSGAWRKVPSREATINGGE
ncbi:hypothetical protein LV779_00475 [Streptomyces thinghirensis]|nr:hypothetical protein [Streptomyces thinghirensis]